MTPEDLCRLYPRLYHMAEVGSWPSILQHGLLSSNEVARRAKLPAQAEFLLRRSHRPHKVNVFVPGIGDVVLRDQIPMAPERLIKALPHDVAPEDWYELINDRVFFWATEDRLLRLLEGRSYRAHEHDVLTLDTRSLVNAHWDSIWLCHMNSGNTFPMPVARGREAFVPGGDYPLNKAGRPVKPVVEVTVLQAVPHIRNHVMHVRRMRGAQIISEQDIS